MSTVGGPKQVTDGLIISLDAANRKSYPGSGTSWYDLYGGGYVGTLTNGPIHNTTHFTFDGTNDSIRFGDILDMNTNPFTINVWARKTADSPSDSYGGALVSKGSFGGGLTGYSTYILETTYNSGQSGFQVRAANVYGTQSGNTIPNNEWLLYTGIRDTVNTEVRHYQNGVLKATTDAPNTDNLDNTFVWTVGALSGNASGTIYYRHLKGDISKIDMYNRALTSQEILQNYNATKSRFGL
jgi:hypothetical protein